MSIYYGCQGNLQEALNKMYNSPRFILFQVEDRLHMATMDATRSADALERHVIQFEAKKIKGLKVRFTVFQHALQHWKA